MKKNWRAMLAMAAALSMCACMTGCGESENTDSVSESNSSVAEESSAVDAFAEISEASVADAEESEEATEAPAGDDPLCTYYDLLAEEWDKAGNTSTVKLSGSNSSLLTYQDGKAVFLVINNIGVNDNEYKLCTYDVNKKELTENVLFNAIGDNDDIYYRDGYVYYSSGANGIMKFDLEGNEIAAIEDKYIDDVTDPLITDSGYIYASLVEYPNNVGYKSIISPDFSKVTSLPTLYGKDSHGLDTEITVYTALAAYGNKIYVCGYNNVNSSYDVYYFDCDTMTWSDSQCTLENNLGRVGATAGTTYYFTSFGKYCFTSGRNIYDMEINEFIADKLPDNFNKTYIGGNSNIVITDDGTFYSVHIPEGTGSLSNFDFSGSVAFGTDSSAGDYNIYRLDDTYYIFADEAGLFLRTYEKGDSEEEIVYVFNK